MARLLSSGFELGSTMEWDTVFGDSPSLSTTTVRSGTYALRVNGMQSTIRMGVGKNWAAVPGNGPHYIRIYFYYVTAPSANNRIIVLNDANATSTIVVQVLLTSTGALELHDEDGQIGSASSALTVNTWYRIEIKVDTTAAAGSHVVEGKIDGTVFATSSTRSLSVGLQALVIGGNLASTSQTVGDWFFDDIAVNDGSGSFQNTYPGAGKIIHLRPDSTGDNSAWTGDYTAIDEVTPNDATDFISSGTLDQIEDVNLDAAPAAIGSSDTINVVEVGGRFNLSSAAGADPRFVYRIKASASGTVEETIEMVYSSTAWTLNNVGAPNTHRLVLYDLPGASTTAWTKADLNTTQIGVRTSLGDSDVVQVTALWLLVDFTPSTTTAYTLTAAAGSFTLTGIAAALKAARTLSIAAGSFVLTGQAAGLNKAVTLIAASGSFTLTGIAANLQAARLLTAAVGSFVLTGQAATLVKNVTLVAATGPFTLTGVAASLLAARKITAEKGTFVLTGMSASLLHTWLLTAGTGAFVLTGQAATLNKGATMIAGAGAFILTGQAVSLLASRKLTAGTGVYVFTGRNVDFIYQSVIVWEGDLNILAVDFSNNTLPLITETTSFAMTAMKGRWGADQFGHTSILGGGVSSTYLSGERSIISEDISLNIKED